MRDMLLYELRREEISHRSRLGCAVVITLAATEQNGPHLPIYTDSLICDRVWEPYAKLANRSIYYWLLIQVRSIKQLGHNST